MPVSGVLTPNRDRKEPHGPSLPHHRTYGSRIRRFGRLSRHAWNHYAQWTMRHHACQPERHCMPRRQRFHPSPRACALGTRRMQYRQSLAFDFSSLSSSSRGTVRAFVGLSWLSAFTLPTTPSADFCPALEASCPGLQSCCIFRCPDTRQTSRGKTRNFPRVDAGFTKCIPAGGYPVSADGGLRGHVPARPRCITPHIRFLFVAPRFRLGLPPHPASRRRTCPLADLRLCLNLAPGLAPG